MHRLAAAGIDMDDVGLALEEQGVASFRRSYEEVFAPLTSKSHQLTRS
jgi:transaldolase